MKSVLTALLSTAYKVDAEKISELLEKPENELTEELLELDKQRVASFKANEKKRFNDGHAKALSETMSKFEKGLKEKFNIDEDLTGEELIDKVIEIKTEEAKAAAGKPGRPANITEDDLKKSAVYIQMQQEFQNKLKQVEQDWKGKYDAREGEIKKQQVLSKVHKRALNILDEMQPILPDDPKVAAKYKEWFLNELNSLNYDENGEDLIPKDAEGKPIEDAHGAIRSFEDLIKEKAQSSFTFNKSQERASTGNGGVAAPAVKPGVLPTPPKNGGITPGKVLPKPKTVEELSKIANSKDYTLAERQQISKEFHERSTANV